MQYSRITEGLEIDLELTRGIQSSFSLSLPVLWNDVRSRKAQACPACAIPLLLKGEPKRPKSKGAIPVISQLKMRLDEHWERAGRPSNGFIFSNELGDPMNLEALAVDVVRPALEKNDLKWHDDEHLCEDGQRGCSQCNEEPGNNVCNYCATREARKHANYVEVFLRRNL